VPQFRKAERDEGYPHLGDANEIFGGNAT
jgi:hypothetical protein